MTTQGFTLNSDQSPLINPEITSNQVNGTNNLQTNVTNPLKSIHNQTQQVENQIKPQGRWNERAHNYLDQLGIKLEEKMPPNEVQKQLHLIYKKCIQPILREAKKLNQWIDKNDYKDWYVNLGVFIGMLPIRAIRNILGLAYNIIKGTVYSFVHPLKALNKLAHLFIQFIESLLIPDTYTKIGAGLLGATAGQAIYSFGIPTLIGLSLGGTLLAIGLIAGAIKSGIEAEEGGELKAMGVGLWNQLKLIPESLLTGFILGVVFGGIQKATTTYHPPAGPTDAQNFVNQYFHNHGVNLDSSAYSVNLQPDGTIAVKFTSTEAMITLKDHGLISYHIDNSMISRYIDHTMYFQNPNMAPVNMQGNVFYALKSPGITATVYDGVPIAYPTANALPESIYVASASFTASCSVVDPTSA